MSERWEQKVMAVRWREFEEEVAAFFERAGFQVEMNPEATRRRQTDAFANDDKFRILVEVKDLKRPRCGHCVER